MKRLLAATIAAAATLAFAQESPPASTPGKFSVALERGGEHEECLHLEAGQSRHYYWRASSPVDFNIHFHRGDEVSYPVKREAMRGDGGIFTAKSAEDYCWMWTAARAPARLDGRIAP
jgi:hypothetical protein